MGFQNVLHRRDKTFQNKGGYINSEEVYLRTGEVKDTSKESGVRDVLFVRISKPILERMGLRAGDRVTLLQDEDDYLKLAVVGAASGPKLTPSNYSAQFESYEDAMGEFCPCNFQMTIYQTDNLPRTGGQTLKIIKWEITELSDNKPALILTLPRDSVQMEKTFEQMRTKVAGQDQNG